MRRSSMSLGIMSVAGLISVIACVGLLMGQGTPRSTSSPGGKKFPFAPCNLTGPLPLVQPRDTQFTPKYAAFTNHALDEYDVFPRLNKNFATFFMSDDAAEAHIHINGKAFKQNLFRDVKEKLRPGKGPDRIHWFRLYQTKAHADGSAEGWLIEWPGDRNFDRHVCQIHHLTWKDAKDAKGNPDEVLFEAATWAQLEPPGGP